MKINNHYYYLYILSLVFIWIILICAIMASRKQKEMFNIDNGISITNGAIPLPDKQLFFTEMSPNEFTSLLKTVLIKSKYINNVQFDKKDEKTIINIIKEHLLKSINSSLTMLRNRTMQKFEIIKYHINNKEIKSNSTIFDITLLLFRETKQYGFVVNINANVDKAITVTKLELIGLLSEDRFKLLGDIDSKNNLKREYNLESKDFKDAESIIKTRDFETQLLLQQAEGLLLDRGISSKSFNNVNA
jgi:hypothetical protein